MVAGLFCGNVGLFCRDVGLFCRDVGLFLSEYTYSMCVGYQNIQRVSEHTYSVVSENKYTMYIFTVYVFCRPIHIHPKTLFEIAMVLSTNSGSFPSNSHVSATFSILLRFGESWKSDKL